MSDADKASLYGILGLLALALATGEAPLAWVAAVLAVFSGLIAAANVVLDATGVRK